MEHNNKQKTILSAAAKAVGPIEKQCFHVYPTIQTGQIYDGIQDDHRFVTLYENISSPD